MKESRSPIEFYTRNKLLLLAHSQKHYRLMGKLVAEGKKMPLKELHDRYVRLLMEALALKTTTRKNINVLQHVIGYFKQQTYLNPHPLDIKLRTHV